MIKEKDIYPEIRIWLEDFLKNRHRRSKIEVVDSHKIKLSHLIFDLGYSRYFPQYNVFDIKVDITGFIKTKEKTLLAFIECKINPINLRDVGQILGYSLVAGPEYSFIISPDGVSSSLSSLFKTFGRYDILEYQKNKRIKIATWNMKRKEIERASVMPPGELL